MNLLAARVDGIQSREHDLGFSKPSKWEEPG